MTERVAVMAAAEGLVPPHALEAERAVLGALLLDPAAINEVVGLGLEAADFYRQGHGRIFRAILGLYERGERPDLVTLSNELGRMGELDAVGGQTELARLHEYSVTTANLEHHARIVLDKSLLRKLIVASGAISSDAYGGRMEVREVLDRAESRVFELADRRMRKDLYRLRDLTSGTISDLQRLYEQKTHITGMPSGLHDVDELTAGFQKGDLVVVAGRPSMGKTSFCMNVAEHVAIKTDESVAFFSLEMSKEQLVQRLLCSQAELDLRMLRTGYFPREKWRDLTAAAGRLHTAPIWIDDTPALSVLELRAKARRVCAETDLKLLIVDYLQLMRGPDDIESRQQEISHITRSLKALAKELSLPIIVLSQLSRAPELRGSRGIPQLSDLRESGAIEQDADVVIFIYREEFYHPTEENKGRATVKIAKQRNGPIGDVEVTFRRQFTRFENYSPVEPEHF